MASSVAMADAHARLGTDMQDPVYARSDSESFGDALLDALGSENSDDDDEQESRVSFTRISG